MKKFAFWALSALALLIPSLAFAEPGPEPFLQCLPQYQSVAVGAVAHFSVVGNVGGPFEWVADDYAVVDQGPYFDAPMTWPGRHQVDAVWGSQRSTCYVDVGGNFGSYPSSYNPYGPGPNVSITSAFYPSLPNAGFEPQNLAAFAFAVVLLLGSGIALYPHAKKAFAIVTR
jgi:hypothetical protein